MFMNLSTLRTELANRLKNTTISSTRLTQWLNMAQDDLAKMLDPDHLFVEASFSTVADTRKYYLEYEFNKVVSLVDTTNDLSLEQESEGKLEEADPDRSDTGTSYLFSVYGYEWVKAQPTSASVVTIVSSSISDSTQKVRINGVVNGVEDTELLTLNGTTSVVGTKSFTSIYSIVKNLVTAGKVTATSNSAAVTLAEIGPNQLVREYQPIHLWPIPTGVNSMLAKGYRKPRSMVNDQDFPEFPSTYHEGVLICAEIRGHFDLYRPTLAKTIKDNVLKDWIDDLKAQMGNKRRKHSPVIESSVPFIWKGGRLGPNFGE